MFHVTDLKRSTKLLFDYLWALVEEEDCENEFLKYLEKEYELFDFDRAKELVEQEISR